MTPRSSIVIVTYNSARTIRECLDATLAQEDPAGFEVVIVDNGSTDDTVGIIEKEYPSVRLVRDTNRGFGAGNNLGVQHARGERIAFVNPDTRPHAGWLRALVDPLDRDGVVTTSKILLRHDPTRLNTCGNLAHYTGYCFTNGHLAPAGTFSGEQEVAAISGAAFGMRRKDFLDIGGFDEDFFLYMEDTDLSWRARRAGLRILLVCDSIVEHEYTLRMSANKIYYLEKGRAFILRKHYRARHWLLLAPSVLLAEALAWGWAAQLGGAGLRAKWRAVREGFGTPIRRHDDLPPLRLRSFAQRRIPFDVVSSGRAVRAAGALVNLLFLANTLTWRRARR